MSTSSTWRRAEYGDEGEEPSDEEMEAALEECVEEFEERAEECGSNANAAMRCMLDADSMEGMGECAELCEEEEEEEE